jgi:hypothetical protein
VLQSNLVVAVFALVARVGGHVGQQRAYRVLPGALGIAEAAVYAGADARGEAAPKQPVSSTCGSSTRRPLTSASICIQTSECAGPPVTRRA